MSHTQEEVELARKVYQWYTANLGKHEEPMGSNNGPFVRSCQAATWLAPPKPGAQGWPWCAAAVNKGYLQAGHPLPEKSPGAWDLSDRATRHGWGERVALNDCKPGMPVAFNVGSGHIAVFEHLDGGTVTTLDGNARDAMTRNTRPASEVRYAWKVKVAHKPAPKQPMFKVFKTTSANGTTKRKLVARAATLDKLIGKLQGLARS